MFVVVVAVVVVAYCCFFFFLAELTDSNSRSRIKADAKFQDVVKEELQSLHNQIHIEAQVREREDDEIVEALNRYTAKLQTSLQIINSTNT